MSNTMSIHIRQLRETLSYTLHQRIRELCQDRLPQLAWAEPCIRLYRQNELLRSGRHPHFVPLVTGLPSWPEELLLSEARLFWADHAVHLLRLDETHCAEVTLSESKSPDSALDKLVTRQTKNLLTLRDKQRFGLETLALSESITAIEYRQSGRLLAWRLILPNT